VWCSEFTTKAATPQRDSSYFAGRRLNVKFWVLVTDWLVRASPLELRGA